MTQGEGDPSNAEDGPILSPEELDIDDDEHVAEIDDGRYVVSPDDPIDDVSSTETSTDTGAPAPADAETAGESDPLTRAEVHEWLRTEFEDADSQYAFDVTAKYDDDVRQRRMVSNDVVTIFESLVLWYAEGIDSSTPVEEVLGILLMEANVPIRYPAPTLQQLLDSTDCSPEDSIADLVEAVDEEDGFRL